MHGEVVGDEKNNPVLYNAVSDELKPPLVMC
jgi:hypothetical protein